ncbi:helix-turn-helix domain-containing protein [Nonomuraea soli]|uniref:Transcriptional regulator with XRE-family HTH domain n=1 Tax=Nonomuraea soli TaxID=1032476 RepID=A0A7W0CSU4_9ACTN|nr:helix-turn-helix transcriptional regulator [Nonomuraea soli]MBA2896592.1 transcriptional regulator with XRE-family HTH domain [Nonomuraea soli]
MQTALLPDGQRFAQLLRTHRDRARLTQEELAERARMSVRALRDLERGRTRYPHRTSVHRLAAALELTGEERVAFESTPPRSAGGPGRAAWEPPPASASIALRWVPLLREVEDAVCTGAGGGHPAVVTIAGPGRGTFAVQCAHVVRVRLDLEVIYVDLGREVRDVETLCAQARQAQLERALDGRRCLLVVDGVRAGDDVGPLLRLGFTGVLIAAETTGGTDGGASRVPYGGPDGVTRRVTLT